MLQKREYSYYLGWSKKIRAIKILGGKCNSCEEDRPWLLTFHHINPKEKEATFRDFRGRRWPIIEKEIKKCILLCFNCHKEVHHINNCHRKSQINKLICLKFKQICHCEICGYKNCNDSIEFHHTHVKKFSVADFINRSKIFKNVSDLPSDLKKELNICKVLCSNCHHNEHFDIDKFNNNKDLIYNHNYKEVPKPINQEQMIKLYKQGFKRNEIARKIDCAKSTVSFRIKKLTSQGIMGSHYKISEKRIKKVLSRLIKKENGCWIWPGGHRKKYGIISFNEENKTREISVHRVLYEYLRNPIPRGLYLCHDCDNSLCCNPDHLFLSTTKFLGEYNKSKGKTHRTTGEKSGMHKLTSEQVKNIRNDNRKLINIAKDYEVVKSTISMIKNNKSRIYG
jgi:DNA-binding Lrp family transcriptional regulator